MLIAAIAGFLFGFIGSMPVAGPIAVLVFTRGVEGKFRSGAAIAIGGALAEAIYAFGAFWGFAVFLTRYAFIVPLSRGVAAAMLIGLGVAFLLRKDIDPRAPEHHQRNSWGGNFALGFTITALNPTLIATWSAATTTLFSTGLVEFTSAVAPIFATGASLGIAIWFLILLWLVKRYKDRFSTRTLNRVVRAMGVFLIGVGGWFLVLLIQYLLSL